MALALLGGTFDPIHKGHLAVARAALEDSRFHLDRVIFVPADLPPHKQQQAITPYADRYAMLELALKDHPRFALSRIEDPHETHGQPNFSIDTVRRFKREHGLSAQDLYFIVGVDSFLNFDKWREPDALLAECRVVVANRPGFCLPPQSRAADVACLETVAVDVSSTQVRTAIAAGEPLEKYVVPAVADYIRRHRLYL